MSKLWTPQQLDQIAKEVEDEISRRDYQTRFNEGMERLKAYMAAHPEEVSNDPMVKALRAMPMRGATSPARTAPSVTSPALPVGRPPTRAELEQAKPWLRPAKPSTKIIDPYAR